ncbi:MAG TPA: c-type cytochrome [Candidatus Rubrimentiphilum sp.]|nr:c-type cytochrome [Candidatus Rubrimentiphilum sp.]
MRKLVTILLSLTVLGACANNSAQTQPAVTAAKNSAAANGRMIYLTGKDSQGFRINALHPPLRTSCAACHGANGSGGVHLPGGAVSADLRQKALAAVKPAYTLQSLQRAISTGIDNQGMPLNPVMPRWQMTPRDLHDVAQFVQTLR